MVSKRKQFERLGGTEPIAFFADGDGKHVVFSMSIFSMTVFADRTEIS
jgi:hypothetical protein